MSGAWRQSLAVLCGVVALLTASSATAQDAEQAKAQAEHARRLAANPEGLSLAIRTQRGTLRFAQGELITLELEFRDDSGHRYSFNPIAYDRSGRLGVDRVVVAPAADVEDPLHDYYRALGFGFIGGGISSLPAPLDGPRTLSLELNEQVRFQRPGRYGIHVESGRFEGGGRGAAQERLIVVSNLLTLEITAPAADGPTETMAARALRFADTPGAARVTGELEPYTSPLSAPIDMPTEERTGLDIVTDIARGLSEETGRRIWVGMMPTNLMVQTSVTVGARNESARSVLWRVLQQLHPSLSWQLLCSVGEQSDCALNIHGVSRDKASPVEGERHMGALTTVFTGAPAAPGRRR
ncbi:hypothetical protein [Luteitalea sp.]